MRNIGDVIGNFGNRMSSMLGMANLTITFVDITEILIVSFLFYHILIWVKSTRAWNLFKGILVILIFVLLAALFQMNTILWIAENTLNVGLIAIVVIFQPELRSVLENIGDRNFLNNLFSFGKQEEVKISDHTIDELIKGTFAMGKVKTGALIVIEDEILLNEYVRTGIDVDAIVSSQLLINIFEHNTPLHDGAVIIADNKIVAATCYLPLSDNRELSKDLGTRHRAAVGISEVTDSLTITVSEETGHVSVAYKGVISRNLDAEGLRAKLSMLTAKEPEKFRLWKGKGKHEKVADK